MEKAGLRLVRTIKAESKVPVADDEVGEVEYALDRAEWEAGRTSD